MFSKLPRGAALSLGTLAAVQAFETPLAVSAPFSVPAGASGIVPHDFASFSFPAHWFADFTGNKTHPNLFSRDILKLLESKSGTAPFIRVGGTSTDRFVYNASQELGSVLVFDDPDSVTGQIGIADWVYIGPAFFEGFHNFPESYFSWQLNMGKTFYEPWGLDNAIEVAQLVVHNVRDKLESFEISNEPELHTLVGHRNGTYKIEDYVQEWNEYANATSERVLKGNNWGLDETRFFQALTFYGVEDEEWSIENAFEKGIDQHGHVKTISFHQYAASNQPWVRLQNSYMNHTANADNITQYTDVIKFTEEYDPPLPFVLGETNSNSFNLRMAQVIGVFGSALWLIDHIMMGMATNVTRYNLIQGTTFGYTGWVPVPLDGRDPYVRPPLYGQIFANEMLGHHPEVQVYPVPKLPWNISAYGVYESGALAKYVVINFDEWNSTTPYDRPTQDIILSVPEHVKSIQVERLTGSGASADEGIQWAGQSWNYTDGRLAESGEKIVEHYCAKGGKATLPVKSTEAILVRI